MTRIRTVVGAAALVFLLASPASAGVEVGADAPHFDAGDSINTEPMTVTDLKGRLILLELFATT